MTDKTTSPNIASLLDEEGVELVRSVAALAGHREAFAASEDGFAAWLLICDLAEIVQQ